LIRNTLLVSNTKDYDFEVILNLEKVFSPRRIKSLSVQREIFVFDEGGELWGTISLEGNTIYSFFVAPDKQKEGIGNALLEHVEAIAREKGLAALLVSASLTAVSFYKRHGYQITGTGGDSDFGRTINMRKNLQQ
jgi:GNAT superfamily N-acetyltransferase